MFEHVTQEQRTGRVIGAIRQRLGTLSLFRRDTPAASNRAAFNWWESRRVSYNLIVGGAGFIACTIIAIIATGSYFFFQSDFGAPGSPLFAIFGTIIYAIVANICFTFGWITELIVRNIWPREADRFATTSFLFGVVFSVLLTLTPAIIVGTIGFFGLFGHLLSVFQKYAR